MIFPGAVQEEIKKVLPELDLIKLQNVVNHLSLVVGVEKTEDLSLVEVSDLQDFLEPIQCRKLVKTFKQRGKKQTLWLKNKCLLYTVWCCRVLRFTLMPTLKNWVVHIYYPFCTTGPRGHTPSRRRRTSGDESKLRVRAASGSIVALTPSRRSTLDSQVARLFCVFLAH